MLPVMAGAVTLTGAPTAATVLQGVTMFAFDLLVRLITGVLLPGVGVYIAVITVNTAVGGGLLGQMAGFVKWAITGAMKLTLTVFIAYLSISGVVGGSADAVAVKTAKFAVSGSVPVVGGIISDAARVHAGRRGAHPQHGRRGGHAVHPGHLPHPVFEGRLQLPPVQGGRGRHGRRCAAGRCPAWPPA